MLINHISIGNLVRKTCGFDLYIFDVSNFFIPLPGNII
jgi:hypothetical protein